MNTLYVRPHSQCPRSPVVCSMLPLKIPRLLPATVHTSLRHRNSLEIQIAIRKRGRIYWKTIAFYAKWRRDNQLQPRGDNQLQPKKAKTEPTVTIHILQFLVRDLEMNFQSQPSHNEPKVPRSMNGAPIAKTAWSIIDAENVA